MLRFRTEIAASAAIFLSLLALLLHSTAWAAPGKREPTGNHRSIFNPMKLHKTTMTWNGDARHYYVHLPPSHTNTHKSPLIFLFHGGGGTASGMERLTGLFAESDKHGAIVVLPQGVKCRWNDGRKFREASTRDDVGFIDKIITDVQTAYNADPKATYAVGISNGGFFSQYLATQLPDRFAAVASVAALVSHEMQSAPPPPHPVPIMFIVGTEDPLIPFKGGKVKVGLQTRGHVVSAEQSIAFWVKANNCSPKPSQTELPVLDAADPTKITKYVYSCPDNSNEVIEYVVHGGGHTWPSGRQYLPGFMIGKVSRQLNTNQVIIDFFLKHRKA